MHQLKTKVNDKTTILTDLPWHIVPCQMREVGICGDTNDLTVQVLKGLDVLTEGDQFSGTHKRASSWNDISKAQLAIVYVAHTISLYPIVLRTIQAAMYSILLIS